MLYSIKGVFRFACSPLILEAARRSRAAPDDSNERRASRWPVGPDGVYGSVTENAEKIWTEQHYPLFKNGRGFEIGPADCGDSLRRLFRACACARRCAAGLCLWFDPPCHWNGALYAGGRYRDDADWRAYRFGRYTDEEPVVHPADQLSCRQLYHCFGAGSSGPCGAGPQYP